MIKAHLLVVDSDPLSSGMLVAPACPNSEAAVFGIFELLVNGVEHGNLGLSYEEKSQLALEKRGRPAQRPPRHSGQARPPQLSP